jgi:hypothetical protein
MENPLKKIVSVCLACKTRVFREVEPVSGFFSTRISRITREKSFFNNVFLRWLVLQRLCLLLTTGAAPWLRLSVFHQDSLLCWALAILSIS